VIAPSRSSTPAALLVQVLQEFYVQATRPTRRDALPHDIAAGLIRTWLRFKVQETSVSIMTGALDIKVEHGLSGTLRSSPPLVHLAAASCIPKI
jgi:hypothetical protein